MLKDCKDTNNLGTFVDIQLSQEKSKPNNACAISNPTWMEKVFAKKSYSNRQILIIIVFAIVEFFAATVISIQAPFFPAVAAGKGASSIEYGIVFGIFELTVFLMSPYFGAKINKWSPKKVFNWGIFTTGFCCLVFGSLDALQDRFVFIGSCLVVRTVEAIGDAAFVVSSFTIIAMEFPDSVATTFGTMETFYGLGMIGGPTIGGALYEAGGYSLPFATMGGLLLLSAAATHFLLPDQNETSDKKVVSVSGTAMFKLLRHSTIGIVAYSIVGTAAGVGFLHATLERHIDHTQHGMNKFLVGTVFILNGGVYAITAPSWGRMCDKVENPKIFTVIGSCFTIAGFVFVAPLFPSDPHMWNIGIGLVLFGLGLGSILVSAFLQLFKDCLDLGYPDDVGTYGLVSGLWTSMTALGFFIGSVTGGVLYSLVGFRLGTLFVIADQMILMIMLGCHFWKRKHTTTSHPESKSNGDSPGLNNLQTATLNVHDLKMLAANGKSFPNEQKNNLCL